jgi:hypothetical protein
MKRQKEWNDGILEYWENQNLEFWNDGTEKSKIGSMEDRKNRVVPFYGRSVLLSFHSSIVPTFHYSGFLWLFVPMIYSPILRISMSSTSPVLPRPSTSFVNPDREKSPRRMLSPGASAERKDAFLRSSFRMSIPTGFFDHLHSAAKTRLSPATATRSISSFPFHHRPARS